MEVANQTAEISGTQRAYARLAGILLVGAIIVALGSGVVLSDIAGNGTFPETAARMRASERLYRVALSGAVMVTLSSSLLAFALYATLKPVNNFLAQLGMIFSLADSFVAILVRMCGFVRLHLYVSGQGDAQPLLDLMRNISGTTENIGGIAFGIGSCIFYYLFLKSRYIPRMISAVGLTACVIWIGLYFASLIFPERHELLQYICFPPMVLAEVATGVYLMVFAVRTRAETARSSGAPTGS